MMGLHEIKKINKIAQDAHEDGRTFKSRFSLPVHGPYKDHAFLKCIGCGVISSAVKNGPDPFLEDVHNEIKLVDLCPSCYQDCADEI